MKHSRRDTAHERPTTLTLRYTQTAAAWVNTQPSVVSSYPQVFALWPPRSSSWRGCICISVHACKNVRVHAPSVLAHLVLLDPGSIWLTQAVCIKGLGVFCICFAPTLPLSSDQGEQMKDTVQRGVNQKNIPTTFLLESPHSVIFNVSFSQLI